LYFNIEPVRLYTVRRNVYLALRQKILTAVTAVCGSQLMPCKMVGRTKSPGNERSREQTRVPGNEKSRNESSP